MPDFDNPEVTRPVEVLKAKYLLIRIQEKTVEINYGNGQHVTLDSSDYNAAEFTEIKAAVLTAQTKGKAKLEGA